MVIDLNELMRNKDNYLEEYIVENANNQSALGEYTRHMVEIAKRQLDDKEFNKSQNKKSI